ncbi:MAG: hypothetical protein ACD_30C00090G0021 [uncultured bacterium]|uniref:Isopentenyl phosphate kinase n=3 Tax=Candidatus Daviesiibacteriota TaxID=1752718 RepID=A0A0G0H7B5_9BACT|nr:MAG: hypothetical protein ACD_30C00090G0021 [uncultured bacterium]KKQ07984.1 MAG: Aspartate/glutamate/uridylate kinase [Candidatus Daviesbacteria bacterium GW2011_GWB1_36_5]KKQ16168.1 MAG: Aspartate/glutamate/uridylate kinase [Candidatus Daviesbacteria bacterium GW2011_GWA1_36_8]OGE33245.1 MAG: hypothetical protein A3C99_01360 [Candidatus Daviesbacteria bacterium RIFCSPHIGHO2_02_FULL_37_9]OGE36147.1 MAG: hypothetical protein A3E66_05050 [Candidatus Daviesbacteria bacterium RIFCSPHIGHO2_12_FU
MKKLIVIKFGGSVITDKKKETPTPNMKNINSLAKQLSQVSLGNRYKFIIVHGAGSYAHPLAKKYQLSKGMSTEEQKFGFALMNRQMLELNLLIVKSLQDYNLSAVGLAPHSFVTQSEGKLKKLDHKIVKYLLKGNQIPVLYGDGVLDDKWGCSILSGDTIVSHLAKKLKAKKVIFLSDVDGIYDSDPKKNPEAKLIKEINSENLEKVLEGITSNNPHDVTGEMKGKILDIKINLQGVPVQVLSGLKMGNLDKAVVQGLGGTRLQFG